MVRAIADAGHEVAALYAAVTTEVPAYMESGNPDVLPELETHLAEHVEALCALAGGARRLDLGFVRAHAERRAEQYFPLDAVLLAYRAMLRTFAPALRDAALAVAATDAQVNRVVAASTDLLAEYGDAAGAALTATYVEHTRHLSETEGDRRSKLLNLLLSGYDESSATMSRCRCRDHSASRRTDGSNRDDRSSLGGGPRAGLTREHRQDDEVR